MRSTNAETERVDTQVNSVIKRKDISLASILAEQERVDMRSVESNTLSDKNVFDSMGENKRQKFSTKIATITEQDVLSTAMKLNNTTSGSTDLCEL